MGALSGGAPVAGGVSVEGIYACILSTRFKSKHHIFLNFQVYLIAPLSLAVLFVISFLSTDF